MKNRVIILISVFLFISISYFAFNVETDAKKKELWEYKIYTGKLREVVGSNNGSVELINGEEILNQLGNEGWELVAIEPKAQGNPDTPLYIFKRKKN